MPRETITGTVVFMNSGGFTIPSGLYLKTDDGRTYRLINASMNTQMPADALHREARSTFEPYSGKQITVEGFVSRGTIWDAIITSTGAGND